MKTLLAVAADPQAEFAAADLATQVKSLFAACPDLCGFVVETLSGLHGDANPYDGKDVFAVTQVSFNTPFRPDDAHQVFRLIVSVISELIAAQPDTYELLRGRTFTRTLH